MSDSPAKVEPAGPPPVSSVQLVLTLALAGALAGFLLVVVDGLTKPRILAYKKQQQELAATEVLGGAARLEKLIFADGALSLLPEGQPEPVGAEVLFRGFDEAGNLVGYALPGSKFGYADAIDLMLGYAPARGELLGMRVLGNKETPGLGDGILKNKKYTGQFPGRALPLVATKASASAPNEVDTITGATISSTAVIVGINAAVEYFAPAIAAFEAQGAKP